METEITNQVTTGNKQSRNTRKEKDKFELVGCPISGIYCSSVLPELNTLYRESEIARINKEYQKSAELLKRAYKKTLLLNETTCAACVDLFQSNIIRSMESMREETYKMSVGIFQRKRFRFVSEKLSQYLKELKYFTIDKPLTIQQVSK